MAVWIELARTESRVRDQMRIAGRYCGYLWIQWQLNNNIDLSWIVLRHFHSSSSILIYHYFSAPIIQNSHFKTNLNNQNDLMVLWYSTPSADCYKHKSTTSNPINRRGFAVFWFSALLSICWLIKLLIILSRPSRGGGHPTQVCQRLCWWNKRCKNQICRRY